MLGQQTVGIAQTVKEIGLPGRRCAGSRTTLRLQTLLPGAVTSNVYGGPRINMVSRQVERAVPRARTWYRVKYFI
jgi:hypothetical protein